MRPIVLATRKSQLALAQARDFASRLRQRHPELTIIELLVTTTGDQILDRRLSSVGGKGLFVKEIEEALLVGKADFAVHSMKDVPVDLADGLAIRCVPRRAAPWDVLISSRHDPLERLVPGAKVGTSSLRRQVQLAAFRQDLKFCTLRGNVDTRIRRCEEGVVDAVILAEAGLVRLGIPDRATQRITAEICLPAVGQGALGIECRTDDEQVASLLSSLHDSETAIAVAAERGVMSAVGGGCDVPLAALGEHVGANLRLRGLLAEPDLTDVRRAEVEVPWPADEAAARAVGLELGSDLTARKAC